MRRTRRAVVVTGLVTGLFASVASPASAAGVYTVSANTEQGAFILQMCAEFEQQGTGCTVTWDTSTYQTSHAAERPVGDTAFNYSAQVLTHSMSWSDTVGSTDSLAVSTSAKTQLWKTVEFAVTSTYTKTWSRSSTVTQTNSLPVPACSVGWLSRAAEMGHATGQFRLQFSKSHTFKIHGKKYRAFIVTDADFTAPTGNGALIARSRPMTDKERASCAG
ncbi:hypothetical protein [Streptomyces sp. NPDC090021]|uniref:hypothetical protein n=1 Tax=Streptomyces sp. NPDC090021 TaxID=3365919 RepID=UPI00382F91CE